MSWYQSPFLVHQCLDRVSSPIRARGAYSDALLLVGLDRGKRPTLSNVVSVLFSVHSCLDRTSSPNWARGAQRDALLLVRAGSQSNGLMWFRSRSSRGSPVCHMMILIVRQDQFRDSPVVGECSGCSGFKNQTWFRSFQGSA